MSVKIPPPSRNRTFQSKFGPALGVAMIWTIPHLPFNTAFAQGTVSFNNRNTAATTHVYTSNPNNVALAGNGPVDTPTGTTGYTGALIGSGGINGQYGAATTFAQLLAAPGADQPQIYLTPALPITTFRTGAAAGNTFGVIATLGNIPVDAPVATVQMVAWDNSSGLYSTWAQASAAWYSGLITAGKSLAFNLYNLGGGTNPLPVLSGLQSFNLYSGTFHHNPYFITQPQSQAATVGQYVAFRVFVSGADPITYQWRLNGSDILDATNDVYTIASADFDDAGTYSVAAATPFFPVTSTNAVLTVQGAPAILTPPQGSTRMVGQAANFSASVAGTPTLFYRWQFNGSNISGATDVSLTLNNVQTNQTGDYRIIVTNSYGGVTSSPAHLVVVDSILLNAYTAVELEFLTSSNITYYIQASPDYNVWTNFDGPIIGNGQNWSKTYSTRATGKLFYRVWIP